MKKILLPMLLLMIISSLTLNAQKEYSLDDFDELTVSGNIELTLQKGTVNKISFRMENAEEEDLYAGVRSGRLKVKLNAVALKGTNDHEFDRLIAWCGAEGFDLTLIETMPLGEIDEDRTDQYLPLSRVRADLETRWTLTDIPYATGGPARYVRVAETGGRLGFITPLSHNFCESCNRVRVTCTGTMYMCLGQEDAADLRAALRASDDDERLLAAIREGITRKPRGHDFVIDRRGQRPAVGRHMSVTGG